MVFSFDLLLNAIVSGILIGGFYAAVTVGRVDLVRHPRHRQHRPSRASSFSARTPPISSMRALGSTRSSSGIAMMPAFYVLGAGIYQVYYVSFEKRGQELLRGLAFFFGLLFITEVSLVLDFGVDYRYVETALYGPSLAPRRDRPAAADARPLPRLAAADCGRCELFCTKSFIGRAIMAVSQDQLGAAPRWRSDPSRIKRIAFAHLDRHRLARRRVPHHHPAGRAVDRARLYRPRVRNLRPRRHGQPAGHGDGGRCCSASSRASPRPSTARPGRRP